MSLYERSQHIVNPNLTKEQAKNVNNAQKKDYFSILHKQIQSIIPPDKIAKLINDNPRRAKIEITNVANKCLSDAYWNFASGDDKKRLILDINNFMFGFGPIETLLDDPNVTEIMVNGSRSIYFEIDGKLQKSEKNFSSDEQVRSLVDRILGPLGRRIDEASPMVNARLASGHRVNAIISPLSLNGTVLTIRKFAEHVISLEEMQDMNSFDSKVLRFLVWSIFARKNIAVSGGTGSGKTTLLNALSCKISHQERVITIEDSAELRFLEHPHVISLEARPQNAEGKGEVTIRDLVINALRMRPDRIVVGECRGAEALDMLQAMNTGHDGSLTTLHANSPAETISRLTTMVRYCADLPVDVIESYIASAIDLVVQTSRGIDGSRYVSQIVGFEFDKNNRRCNVVPYYFRGPLEKRGKWIDYPKWIDELSDYLLATKEEVEQWKL